MEISIIIILVALMQYMYFITQVGFSRGKYEVSAPKTTGNENWERMFRVQQNTAEQLIIFIPGIIAFSTYVSPLWVLIPGTLFIIGRQTYSHLYQKDPSSRSPGFVLSFFSNAGLVVGSLIGIVLNLLG